MIRRYHASRLAGLALLLVPFAAHAKGGVPAQATSSAGEAQQEGIPGAAVVLEVAPAGQVEGAAQEQVTDPGAAITIIHPEGTAVITVPAGGQVVEIEATTTADPALAPQAAPSEAEEKSSNNFTLEILVALMNAIVILLATLLFS